MGTLSRQLLGPLCFPQPLEVWLAQQTWGWKTCILVLALTNRGMALGTSLTLHLLVSEVAHAGCSGCPASYKQLT